MLTGWKRSLIERHFLNKTFLLFNLNKASLEKVNCSQMNSLGFILRKNVKQAVCTSLLKAYLNAFFLNIQMCLRNCVVFEVTCY